MFAQRLISRYERDLTMRFRVGMPQARASLSGAPQGQETVHIFPGALFPLSAEEVRRAAGGALAQGTHQLFMRPDAQCRSSGHTHTYGAVVDGQQLQLAPDDVVEAGSFKAVVIGCWDYRGVRPGDGFFKYILAQR